MIASQIKMDVCDEFRVPLSDLTSGGKRNANVTAARRVAIDRLKHAGLSHEQISRCLKISTAAIRYHLYPARKARVIEYARAYEARKAAEEFA